MDLIERARRHAALGDPVRLALVDDLISSDRSPGELAERHGLASNLLAHHLSVLEEAGIVDRVRSSGDGRRRYVRFRGRGLGDIEAGPAIPEGPVLFVCTHNSARSQMAAALWSRDVGSPAASAGTHPANRVHPGAVAAAERAGLDLSAARPRHLDDVDTEPALVVTVCDRAHEELPPDRSWWHWSIADPITDGTPHAFDLALGRLEERIRNRTRSTAT
jgi:protein-tyrosine-phosphatase